MIISFTNVIGAIRSLGEAAQVITTNLKMWLGFETSSIDGDSQITPDKSGNNNVGELFTGKALEFDGSTSYVSANSFAGTLSTGDAFTFAIWFNSEKTLPARFFGNILISSGGTAQATNIFKIGVNPRTTTDSKADSTVINIGGIYFDDSNGYNNVVPSSGGVNYNDGEWHRLVVARRAGSGVKDLSFYVDGSLIGVADCNPLWSNMSVFDIGQEWDGAGESDFFQGKMSNIQVYNYAWTTDDITYDYANPQNLVTDRSGTSIELSNLKGYWHLSEGAGSLAYDSSGEGNNGTINGATYEPAQPRIPQLGMQNWSKGSNLLTYSEDFNQSVWLKTNVVISSSSINSPIGTNNVDYFVPTTTTGTHLIKLTTDSLSNDKVISINVKVDSAIDKVTLFPGGSNTFANFNLSNLTSTEEANVVSTNIVNLGSGWYRLEAVYDSAITLDRFQFYASSGTNGASSTTENGTDGINIWGAQLVEGTSLSAYRLTDGAATLNSTVIPKPNNTSQDILGNAVRDRLNSFNLDGSGYSSVANSSTLEFGTSAFTIQAWIKPFSLAADNRILTKGVTSNGEFMISVGGDGLSARVFAKDSNGNSLDTSNDFSSLNINSWQMITVIIDTPNDKILFFKNDGNVETKTGASWTGNFNNTQPITIGNTSNVSDSQFFDGLVSDALVYKDKALTSDEIENNYNAGLSAHTN